MSFCTSLNKNSETEIKLQSFQGKGKVSIMTISQMLYSRETVYFISYFLQNDIYSILRNAEK